VQLLVGMCYARTVCMCTCMFAGVYLLVYNIHHNVGTDLPAGQSVKLLVGFSNKGSQDFVVESMDAAFRYPQDYSFYIQNVCMWPSAVLHLQFIKQRFQALFSDKLKHKDFLSTLVECCLFTLQHNLHYVRIVI